MKDEGIYLKGRCFMCQESFEEVMASVVPKLRHLSPLSHLFVILTREL
jgi:hypothetical protein